MKDKILDYLVNSGILRHYDYTTCNSYGERIADEEAGENDRETERLVLTFANGEVLIIDTFCSGSMQNTHLEFSRV